MSKQGSKRYLVGYLYKESGGRHFDTLGDATEHVTAKQKEEPDTPLAIWDGDKVTVIAWQGIFYSRK